MRKLLMGVLIGFALGAPSVFALRIARPPEFNEWNTNTFTQLNNVLLGLWNVTNGRTQLDVVTVTPNGARTGNKGEMVLFDTGTDQFCVNVDGAKTWRCVNLT